MRHIGLSLKPLSDPSYFPEASPRTPNIDAVETQKTRQAQGANILPGRYRVTQDPQSERLENSR